ncbi:MAG TPA: MATE family efflux transporter [Gammaproteobacteria bacterium]|nr:MATE family efflux transporter [Gammaproteobacteria bacterium]
MTKFHEIKSTVFLILPLMLAFLSQKGMQFIDTLMMGWLGPSALAAGAVGTAIFITILVFCMGTLSAVGVFIARAKGANDENDIVASLQNGIVLAILLSLPCIIIIWLAPHFFIRNENAAVIHNAALLLHGLSIGLPGYLLFLVFREFISAFSLTRIVMLITFTSLPLTFFINYVLIYGRFGLPALGIAGIGYAGAIVMWFMFLGLLFYTLLNHQLKKYCNFKLVSLNLGKMKNMLLIGFPSGAFFLLESAMFLTSIMMMGYFGVEALAAFQIAMQCVNIAYAIPFSLSMATALQVSHAAGSKEFYRFKIIAFQNFGLGLLFSIIVAIFFIFFPEFFVKIFLNNESNHINTIKMASSFLVIAAFFQCFDAIQAIANGMLRGLKDTLIPMVLSVASYWIVGIASSYYLSFHTVLGPEGIWYGILLGICTLGTVLMIRLIKKL